MKETKNERIERLIRIRFNNFLNGCIPNVRVDKDLYVIEMKKAVDGIKKIFKSE